MKYLIIIGIIILATYIAYKTLKSYFQNKRCKDILLTVFSQGNVLVAGHKGTGKDLLFNYVICEREKRGEVHSANIAYTERTKIRAPRDYCLSDNSYEEFTSGNYKKESKNFTEREDYYISEAGLCLPSWLHSKLEKDKVLKKLPITFALSRQLANFNIHSNAQSFTRIWDKLREQADYLIWTEKAKVYGKKKPKKFKITFIIYNRSETALQHTQPFEPPKNLFGQIKKPYRDSAYNFNAKNGYVERLTIRAKYPKNSVYKTRDFYKKLYEKDAPEF